MGTERKKGQIWGIDFIMGTAIFLLSLILFYVFMTNLFAIQGGRVSHLMSASETVSSFLVSEGLPIGGDADDVKRIGITDGKQDLNATKLAGFSQIVQEDYRRSMDLLNTEYNYYIFFLNKSGAVVTIDGINGIGKAGVNSTNVNDVENPAKLIKVYRLLNYNSTIVRMVLYLWQK